MTKFITKILLSFIIFCSFSATMSEFNQPITKTQTAYAEDSATREFKPAIIPKATNLPGPIYTSDQAKSNRSIFGETVLPKIAVFIIGFAGGLSLLFLVIGGVRFATAYSNEENIGNAKNQVIYAIVGLLISMLSYAVVAIVTNLKFEGNQTPTAADNAADQSERAPQTP